MGGFFLSRNDLLIVLSLEKMGQLFHKLETDSEIGSDDEVFYDYQNLHSVRRDFSNICMPYDLD